MAGLKLGGLRVYLGVVRGSFCFQSLNSIYIYIYIYMIRISVWGVATSTL